jgi:hypothetical protein
MLDFGNQHLYLTAGQTWSVGKLSQFVGTTHLDVLEDSVVVLTCNWLDHTGAKFSAKSITMLAGRYDMEITAITVTSGSVHLVRI